MSLVGAIFLTLMGMHIGFSFWFNRGRAAVSGEGWRYVMGMWPFYVIFFSGAKVRTPAMRSGAVLQTLLFAAACWLAIGNGAWGRHLLSPLAIGGGLLAGHLIFGGSVLVTHRSIHHAAGHLIDLGPLWDYMADNPRVLMQFTSVSLAEETIYRGALQPLLSGWLGPWAGILLVGLVFSFVHEHFFRNTRRQSGEFLGFALLLGLVYYWTGSLILVIVIHAVRNIEIAFMERLSRIEEAGGVDAAQREIMFDEGRLVQALIVAPVCDMATACVDLPWEPPSEPAGNPVEARHLVLLENL